MTGHCQGCGSDLPPNKAPGRARKWCSERCRKASYGDPCVDCGARTCYGAETARVPEPRCAKCAPDHYRTWTADRIIERIQTWAAIHGEPPASGDWNPWQAATQYHDLARARAFRDGEWPWATIVIDVFGRWNAAIAAAGFEPRAPHGGNGNASRRRDHHQQVAA